MSDLLRAVLGQLNLWFSALLTRLMLGKEMSSWLIISERGWKGMAWAKGHFSLFFSGFHLDSAEGNCSLVQAKPKWKYYL